MQEEVENRTVNLMISTTKLGFRGLMAGYRKFKQYQDKAKAAKAVKKNAPATGKQSIKELIGQNQGVTNLEIGKTGIRDFERFARKYGVDFAIKLDKSVTPPKYLVFFKARDSDALTAAFNEYSAYAMNRAKKPSVLKQLKKFTELVAAIPKKVRNKEQERNL